MEAGRKTHPLVIAAAISVIVLSATGVAALTGVLPSSSGKSADPAPPPVAEAPPPAPVPEIPTSPEIPKVSAHKAPHHRFVAKKHEAPARVAEAQPAPPPPPPPAPARPAIDPTLGTVESVREVADPGKGDGLGVVAGGIAGAVLGHQVGHGSGRDLATILGAVGGAFTGNQVQKKLRTSKHWEITVRLDDGSIHTLSSTSVPPWQPGDRVRLRDGALQVAG